MSTRNIRVLGLVFPGFNIMDLTGPMEVLGNSNIPPETRHVHIASAIDVTKSAEGVSVKRDVSFTEVLAIHSGGATQLSSYDVLVIPGGPAIRVQAALEKDEGILDIIKTFAKLEGGQNDERWLLSVCTGAGFLGAVGLFHEETVTTHFAHFDMLRDICTKAGTEVNIVRKRFVDVGKTRAGVRLITAGGVSCGIDAALWVSSKIYGIEKATTISKFMDYDWKYSNVEFTEGYLV